MDTEFEEVKKGHVNKRLSNVAYKFKNNEYVINFLLPEVSVGNGSDDFTIFDKGNQFQNRSDIVGKFSGANEIKVGDSLDQYKTIDRALKGFVSDTDVKEEDAPLSIETNLTEAITKALLNKKEKRGRDLLATLTQTATPGTKWASAAATPIDDIESARTSMFHYPNRILFGRAAWDKFRLHPNTISSLGGGFTGLQKMTTERVAELFDVDMVIIGEARIDANQPPNTPSWGRIWEDEVFLAKVDPNPSRDTETLGQSFQKRLMGEVTMRVREWREEDRGTDGGKYVQVAHSDDAKIIQPEFGFFLFSTNA